MKHPWWSGEPAKKGGIVKVSMKRGKQTIDGNAVYVASTYKGGK